MANGGERVTPSLVKGRATTVDGEDVGTFDLETEKRDRTGNLVEGNIELDVVAEPVEGKFHSGGK